MPDAGVYKGVVSARPTISVEGEVREDVAEDLRAMHVEETTDGLYNCEMTFSNWGPVGPNEVGFQHFDRETFGFGTELMIDALAGDDGRHRPLYRKANAHHFGGGAQRGLGHDGSAIATPFHQSLLGQQQKRLANRALAASELVRQRLFDEMRARLVDPEQDRPAQRVAGLNGFQTAYYAGSFARHHRRWDRRC